MNSYSLNNRIEDLLDDPMVSLMMRADGVDRASLARQLGTLEQWADRRSLRDDKTRRAPRRDSWRGQAFALCGACA